MFPVIFSTLTLVSTGVGGLLAVRYWRSLAILAAFAAGVLIAVSFFDLLPEALRLAPNAGVTLDKIMYVTAAGFIFLLILERYFFVHRVCLSDGRCTNVRHPKGGAFGSGELCAHSFMDGLVIGIGFQVDFQVGIIVALAVIAHDFSDGLNTVTRDPQKLSSFIPAVLWRGISLFGICGSSSTSTRKGSSTSLHNVHAFGIPDNLIFVTTRLLTV